MNTEEQSLNIEKGKYYHQTKYLKKRKETDPDYKKQVHLFIINYKRNRYNTDDEYKQKVREYAKNKMRDYREQKKKQQQETK